MGNHRNPEHRSLENKNFVVTATNTVRTSNELSSDNDDHGILVGVSFKSGVVSKALQEIGEEGSESDVDFGILAEGISSEDVILVEENKTNGPGYESRNCFDPKKNSDFLVVRKPLRCMSEDWMADPTDPTESSYSSFYEDDDDEEVELGRMIPESIEEPSHKKVTFGTVEIREYACTVGDHPFCGDVCPLTLDWAYYSAVEDDDQEPTSVDTYECKRFLFRRRIPRRLELEQRRDRVMETLGIDQTQLAQMELYLAATRLQNFRNHAVVDDDGACRKAWSFVSLNEEGENEEGDYETHEEDPVDASEVDAPAQHPCCQEIHSWQNIPSRRWFHDHAIAA